MAVDVFISYSGEDKPIADAICSGLETVGIRCWIAPRDIPPGLNYAKELIHAIDDSSMMVVVFSSHSNQSPHVTTDVTRAVSKGLIIVPFRIEDVPLSESMEYLISVHHLLDAFTPPLEQHIEKLVQTIKLILNNK
jgi:hypothetical protein